MYVQAGIKENTKNSTSLDHLWMAKHDINVTIQKKKNKYVDDIISFYK